MHFTLDKTGELETDHRKKISSHVISEKHIKSFQNSQAMNGPVKTLKIRSYDS